MLVDPSGNDEDEADLDGEDYSSQDVDQGDEDETAYTAIDELVDVKKGVSYTDFLHGRKLRAITHTTQY